MKKLSELTNLFLKYASSIEDEIELILSLDFHKLSKNKIYKQDARDYFESLDEKTKIAFFSPQNLNLYEGLASILATIFGHDLLIDKMTTACLIFPEFYSLYKKQFKLSLAKNIVSKSFINKIFLNDYHNAVKLLKNVYFDSETDQYFKNVLKDNLKESALFSRLKLDI